MLGVRTNMVKTICVHCGRQGEIPDGDVDISKLDKMARLSFEAGILRVVCDECAD